MRMYRGIVLVVFCMLMVSTVAAATALENEQCMQCHGRKDIRGSTQNQVYVDPAKFAATKHALIGCTSCHDQVSSRHPDDGIPPSRATCGDCHGPVSLEYSQSIHASKARCNDCHNPHEVKLPMFMSCAEINSKCARCHDTRKMITSHSKWLPQADLHIDTLLCITCHTGSKDYVITMTIEMRQPGSGNVFKAAKFEELAALNKSNEINRLIDVNNDNLVSIQELRDFNRKLRGMNMRLQGVMTPEIVTHSYQILDNRWDCSFCHASGPSAMQKSSIALPDASGGFTRIPVEKGAILDILYGTPDFYMLGSTRSTPLNIIGAVIIAGGMAFPLGHGFFRFLTRKNRKEKHHGA